MSRVAIQVLLYKSSSHLAPLLSSLKAQAFQDFDVWFCDNSEDAEESKRARELVESSGLHAHFIISEKNTGFAGGHEALYRMHDAPLVLLLNDDAKFESAYLEATVRCLELNSKVGSVTGLVYRDETKTKVDTAGLIYHCLGRIVDRWAGQAAPSNVEEGEVFGVSAAVGIYRRSAVDIAGGLFDPTWFMYKEDVDLAIRLRRAGFISWFEPKAIATHPRGIKEEGGGVFERIANERRRSVRARESSYVNQWRIYHRYWKTIGWKDKCETVITEIGRSALVFLASPNVLVRARSVVLNNKNV